MARALLGCVALGACLLPAALAAHPPGPMSSANCTEWWFDQYADHFTFRNLPGGVAKFKQRIFQYDGYATERNAPIFFYTGNEGDVTNYVNWTGLLWNQAKAHKGRVVFAEHRYYGKTQPCGMDSWKHCRDFLSVEQALADYAYLTSHLRQMYAVGGAQPPVISYGGSYGGMLSSWFRMKYPTHIIGAIASSAPIFATRTGLYPPFNQADYWKVVTEDALPSRGSGEKCAAQVHQGLSLIQQWSQTAAGRANLTSALKLCKPPTSAKDAEPIMYWIQNAWDNMAMANYPYPCTYFFGTDSNPAPAFPVRVACKPLADTLSSELEVLEGLREAVGVMYNWTRSETCFDVAYTDFQQPGPYDWQVCTEFLADELPYYQAQGPPNDMFWNQTYWTTEKIAASCLEKYGVYQRQDWVGVHWGGHEMIHKTSNIVFANGEFDPWQSGGVFLNTSTVKCPFLYGGAHHMDLFWPNPMDPPSAKMVRDLQGAEVARWLKEYNATL